MNWAEMPLWVVCFLGYFTTIYGAGFGVGYLVGLWRAALEPSTAGE